MTEVIRPPAPEAKITLDRERTLRCDMYAMRLFKRETKSTAFPEGMSLLKGDLFYEDDEGERHHRIDEDNVAEFVWAFLSHEDEDLTIDAVSKMIHPGNMAGVLLGVFGVMAEGLPENPKEGVDGETEEGGAAGEDDDPLGETTESP